MTVLTFPSNPTNGQQYAAPNGIQYVFDGVKWIVETTSSSSEAVSNSTQDRVAPMFVDGDNSGITFTYNAETNIMSAEVTAVNGNQLVNGDKTVTLGTDGATTFPTGGQIANYPGGVGVSNNSWFVTPGNDGNGGVSSQDGQQYIQINNNFPVEIGTSYGTANESIWRFGQDGKITAPYGTLGVTPQEEFGISADADTAAVIKSNDGAHKWAFETGGDLRLPVGGDIVDSTGASVLNNGVSITDFGEGFSLTATEKIVTNKLYSTNLTQPNQHYRLTLDTNGVVILPDQSIINGATLKSVAGNYAGITAGPVGRDEDSWMWVDGDGAWIGTTYSTDQKTWHFDNTGKLTLPTNGTISFGTDNGDNWNAPLVNTVQAALEELAARITAVENIEIEGGNAYAIAGPELIIDGNGA